MRRDYGEGKDGNGGEKIVNDEQEMAEKLEQEKEKRKKKKREKETGGKGGTREGPVWASSTV